MRLRQKKNFTDKANDHGTLFTQRIERIEFNGICRLDQMPDWEDVEDMNRGG